MKTIWVGLLLLSAMFFVSQSAASDPGSSSPSPTATARPSVTPTPSGSPSPTVAGKTSTSPQASVSDDNQPPKVGGRLKSQAKRFHPSRIEPMPPGKQPGAAGAGADAPNAESSDAGGQPLRPRPEGMRRKNVLTPRQHPGSSPTQSAPGASVSPSPASSASPTP